MSTAEDNNLVSPLLYGAQSDYSGGDGSSGVDTSIPVEDAPFGEYVSKAKARSSNNMRICGCIPFNLTMILMIMFLTFGSYWCYDIPGSIETELSLWFGSSYTHASNLLFYSIYSWPNCILAFFGGFILDKVTGVRKGALLFCGLVSLGQFIFALGCQWKMYYLALFGRFVFGLGGENLTVAQNTYTVRWFDGKRLALAFGLVVAFSRIGTSVNFVVSPILANKPSTYTQSLFDDAGCQVAHGAGVEGRVNGCQGGRDVQCDATTKEDDTPTTLYLFPTLGLSSGTCHANATAIVPVANDECFVLPSSTGAASAAFAFVSGKVHILPNSNQYALALYASPACVGPNEKAYGQGRGCANGTQIGGMDYRIDQPISTLCYVAEYSTSTCDDGTEVNRWGMQRDQCTPSLDPTKDAYKFAIDPGTGVPLTVWFGMGMCAMSFCACMLASFSDFWGESKVESDRQVFLATLSSEEASYVRALDDANEPTSDDISFAMVRRIPGSAWLLFLITSMFYVAILNFYQVASDMMQNTGDCISGNTAGLYMAIPNFVAIIGSPLGGFMVDKMGRALIFISVACGMLICAHVFFLALAYGWVVASPVPVMIWLGITYSLGASSLWPILAFIVEKDALGTAYGCMTSVQNVHLAVAALVIGQLQDWASSSHPGVLQYTLPIMIFIGCAITALCLTILLIFVDRKAGGKLNASAEERAVRLAQEEAEQEARNQATRGEDGNDNTEVTKEKETSSVALAIGRTDSAASTPESSDQIVSSSPSKSINPPPNK